MGDQQFPSMIQSHFHKNIPVFALSLPAPVSQQNSFGCAGILNHPKNDIANSRPRNPLGFACHFPILSQGNHFMSFMVVFLVAQLSPSVFVVSQHFQSRAVPFGPHFGFHRKNLVVRASLSRIPINSIGDQLVDQNPPFPHWKGHFFALLY